jgi:hypothetical protein
VGIWGGDDARGSELHEKKMMAGVIGFIFAHRQKFPLATFNVF